MSIFPMALPRFYFGFDIFYWNIPLPCWDSLWVYRGPVVLPGFFHCCTGVYHVLAGCLPWFSGRLLMFYYGLALFDPGLPWSCKVLAWLRWGLPSGYWGFQLFHHFLPRFTTRIHFYDYLGFSDSKL